ncbi:IclR family transcriptional regulator [Pollutimonas subterranea]|uniref:IclR family transcriptional regulator n=1 Tax=Pollutimonas subterranea TaxID=2045210 RepID=A0A2N4U5R0_9BURK|nr:IclR family transcriptional regulator [Pollutimonas subterranea]PLC50365.1 IclR family transcriptional regulator [Pollutimonas subterranea]
MQALNKRKDPQFASTLAQGIDVLACFQAGEISLGNKDFAERTGLSRSTVARLTHTLLELGYLRRDPGGRRYRPGAALLVASYPLLASLQIRQIARPLMIRLAAEINGAVSLVIRDRQQMVYVETARANEALHTHPDIGASLPMLSTAAGKAWLCRASAEERAVVLNQIRLKEPGHYARHAAAIDETLLSFEKLGYCGNNAQWYPQAYGFAVPMSRAVDSNLFVFNSGVPVGEGSFHERAAQIGPKLFALVQGIENMLGFRY